MAKIRKGFAKTWAGAMKQVQAKAQKMPKPECHPNELVGKWEQSGADFAADDQVLLRRHNNGKTAALVRRVPATTQYHTDSWIYEVRDHLGNCVASGTCDRFDITGDCADGKLFQLGYLQQEDMGQNTKNVLMHPAISVMPTRDRTLEADEGFKANGIVDGQPWTSPVPTAPEETAAKIKETTDRNRRILDQISSANDDELVTVQHLLRTLPHEYQSMGADNDFVVQLNELLASATRPHGLLQLMVSDLEAEHLPRLANHRTHSTPSLIRTLMDLNRLRRKQLTDQNTTLSKVIQGLENKLRSSDNDRLERQVEEAGLGVLRTSQIHQEEAMGHPQEDDKVIDAGFDGIDGVEAVDPTMIKRVMADPTISLAIEEGINAGKIVGAVRTQELFHHIARKLATRFIPEEYIGILDTPAGDIVVSAFTPLAVHAVVTHAPAFGMKVPGGEAIATISAYAFKGQLIRLGIQYAPKLTDLYDLVSDELGQLRTMAEAFVEANDAVNGVTEDPKKIDDKGQLDEAVEEHARETVGARSTND
jgi:hypothetical protein